MPSEKKRINLTVPDEIYARILAYSRENGFMSDATACLNLIVRQLDSYEQSKALLKILNDFPKDKLEAMAKEGTGYIKDELDKHSPESK